MKEGWEVKTLGEVCESKLGKTLNSSTDSGRLCEYLCSINVQWNRVDLSVLKKALFNDEEIDKYRIQKGDLLICEGGEAGRAAIWESDDTILYQNALHRVRFKDGTVSPRFCLHYLYMIKRDGTIDKLYSRGATIKHLVTKSLYSIPIPLPPLPEQERIVSILDTEFAKIDAVKAGAEKSLQHAKDLFQAALKKELTPKEGWETKKLQDICTEYGDYGMSLPSKQYDGIRYLRITDITEWGDLNDDKVSADADLIDDRYILRNGDILFARTGATVGKTLVYNEDMGICSYAGYLIRYRPNQSLVLPRMMYYITHSTSYYDWISSTQKSTTLPNISAKLYNSYQVSLPRSIEKQQSIVARLDTLNTHCKTLQANYERTIALCDDMKQALLRKAFNGEL